MTAHTPHQTGRTSPCAARLTADPTGALAPDAGLIALELALLTPVVIALLLLVVGLGRISHARQLVEQGAAAAARAAALAGSAEQGDLAARQAAAASLADAGMSCAQLQISVNTSGFGNGGVVDVQIACTAELSGLALAGLPGSLTLTATDRSPIETYRDLTSPATR